MNLIKHQQQLKDELLVKGFQWGSIVGVYTFPDNHILLVSFFNSYVFISESADLEHTAVVKYKTHKWINLALAHVDRIISGHKLNYRESINAL